MWTRIQPALSALLVVFVVACGESSDARSPSANGGSGAAGQGSFAGAGAHSMGGTADRGSDTSGSSGQGGAAGVSGTTTAGAGSTPSAGSSGASATGGGGSGDASCTRQLLSSATDAYFSALQAHDPSRLPLASSVKLTENGEVMAIGEAPLWQTAGALVYKHTALDTVECSAASQAVIVDGEMDIPFALRLRLVGEQITEIETIAVRPGDYPLATSNTAALAASGSIVKWGDPVSAAERNTREEIVGWMNKYFRLFPAGVCNTTSACRRIENGGGDFMCSAGGSCSAQGPGPGDNELSPRLILADVDTGVGVGFTMFQGNTDMHMFKMFGDEVHGVSAVLGQAASSGW